MEDKKFLLDQARKERMATALEAILLQFIIFSIFIFLNMTGFSKKFSITIGLIYVVLFLSGLIYSASAFLKNQKKIKEATKIEKSLG